MVLLLAAVLVLSFSACGKKPVLWENAIYLEDTELGDGAKTFALEVKAGEKTVTFTVHTDEDNVGAALLKNKIIEGEDGPYGFYIKKVNGITADFDIDQSYWAFYVGGEYATAGVDQTEIKEGTTYGLVYSK